MGERRGYTGLVAGLTWRSGGGRCGTVSITTDQSQILAQGAFSSRENEHYLYAKCEMMRHTHKIRHAHNFNSIFSTLLYSDLLLVKHCQLNMYLLVRKVLSPAKYVLRSEIRTRVVSETLPSNNKTFQNFETSF